MARPSPLSIMAVFLMLAACGFLLWKRPAAPEPARGSPAGSLSGKDARPLNRRTSPDHPALYTQPREGDGGPDLERIREWLADESLSPEEASRNLWALASDPSRPAAVRDEALLHALNLTDDETFESTVIPLLGRKGLLTDGMSEKILDDLYNRPPALKLGGTLALFRNSSGELHTSVRELLVFELGDPEPEDISDSELIRLATERMRAPADP